MKLSILRDTLAYQIGMRPGVQLRDMSPFQVPAVVESLNKYMDLKNIYSVCGSSAMFKEAPSGNAERDGLIFYMMNHAVSVVRAKVHDYQPLDQYLPILQAYHEELAARSSRMFFYMLLICTRESRHEHNGSKMPSLYTEYGPTISKFHKSIRGTGSSGAAEALKSNPPADAIGAYTRFLADAFNQGSYSSGYGGPAWGKVAEVLRDFTIGKISAEMMMDTAFTLCHNGGPIFNKGMLFDGDFQDIYKILDVQRAGQIPQLVESLGTKHAKDEAVQRLFKLCKDILGKDFAGEGYVDWYKVESLGSLKKYPTQKAAQSAKYGVPEGAKEAKPKISLDDAIEATPWQNMIKKGKPPVAVTKDSIQIFPNMYITKIKKVRTPA